MAQLPITDPVLIVATAMGVFLVAPLLAQAVGMPGLVGLLLAGALVGPNGLHLIARDDTIVLLGTVGIVYLMFVAGLEIDRVGFRKNRVQSVAFGALTFLVPMVVGYGVGLGLGYDRAGSVLLASMFASHTLTAYPIATRLGIAKNRAVVATVGGTVITDTAALLVLAVVSAFALGQLDLLYGIRLAVLVTAYIVLIGVGVSRIGRWFFQRRSGATASAYVFVLAILFGGAYLAQAAGVESIVGAFLVGLALNPLIPEHGPLANRIHFVGEAVFIPFFLLSVGMLVDPRVLLGDARAWQVMVAMSLAVIGTKWVAARLTGALFGYSPAEGWLVFGLSVPQAAATLAATLVGYRLGIFDDAVVNGSILMILVTSLVGPWAVERYGREVALHAEASPLETAAVPTRILVPLANPSTADALMDLALALRESRSREAVYPVAVVDPTAAPDNQGVLSAERMLGHAVTFAAAAQVPVSPEIRLEHHVPTAIARAAVETRASLILLGWDGRRSATRRIFGTVLDQVLDRSEREVLVAHVGDPLSTTTRVHVVVPPGTEAAEGTAACLLHFRTVAERLGVEIDASTTGPGSERLRHLLARLKVTLLPGADHGERPLGLPDPTRRGPDDLVAVISARRGSAAWRPALDRVPSALLDEGIRRFVVAYPSEVGGPAASTAAGLPRALTADRIVGGLPCSTLPDCVRILVRSHFTDEARVESVTRALTRAEATEIDAIGPVLLLHAHLDGLDQPLAFLGGLERALTVGAPPAEVRFLYALLSPEEPAQQHLEHLADFARFISGRDDLEDLVRFGPR